MTSTRLILLWICGIVGFFWSFVFVGWGHGIARFFLLVAFGAWIFGFRRVGEKMGFPSTSAVRLLWSVVAVLAGGILIAFALNLSDVFRSGVVASDQGQNSAQAIALLKQRINPYGRNVMIDPHELNLLDRTLLAVPQCLPPDYAPRPDIVHGYGPTITRESMAALLPKIPDVYGCDDFKMRYESLGFKYGPVLLLNYWFFVEAFGQAGILVNHFLLLALLVAGFIFWFRVHSNSSFAMGAAFLVFFGSARVLLSALVVGHSDLFSAVTVIFFLMLWFQKKDFSAAAVLALSFGAKTFPALIFAPLLVRQWKAAALFIALAVGVYAPFVLWDPRGLWNNFTYPILWHYFDTTALGYYLPEWASGFLPVFFVGSAWLGWKAVRSGWDSKAVFDYLIYSHLAAYAAGKMFHNNYLMWFSVLLTLFVFHSVTGRGASGLFMRPRFSGFGNDRRALK